ncbi:RloB family protein [Bifidobacterium sp. ESL0745]|uniref:RloB family protein n=1 Tax=Bifidobacterium sp. ESL0745 TaxID=2983226 RepID=UPI0023F90E04|nr:RloB family protein [Bifidobacterium sp. ESL0745]MDF7665355.1 RloB family protein [Bifidobacterium sp. ESL0745]
MNRSKGRSSSPRHGRGSHSQLHTRKKRYLVVCGGEKTERQYFEFCEAEFNVVIDFRPGKKSPSQLADYAVTLKEKAEKDRESVDSYSAVWVVVDVDNYHDHKQAEKTCKDHGISLIISNPCFEVWLIDHHNQCPPSCTRTKDAENRAAKLGLTSGRNHKDIVRPAIKGQTDTAIIHANRHNIKRRERQLLTPNREQAYAPWTDMPQVIKRLKG